MTKSLLLTVGCLVSGGVLASPMSLNDGQMDLVTGGSFVCPVIKTENVTHSPKSGVLGDTGFYTIGGPQVGGPNDAVPMHATNGDGAGSPGGENQTSPGDPSYTAIWYQ